MNRCPSCGHDFAAVDGFDRHRVGRHDFLYEEGLRMLPPRTAGRRCLSAEEMTAGGMSLNARGRWQIDAAVARARRHFSVSDRVRRV